VRGTGRNCGNRWSSLDGLLLRRRKIQSLLHPLLPMPTHRCSAAKPLLQQGRTLFSPPEADRLNNDGRTDRLDRTKYRLITLNTTILYRCTSTNLVHQDHHLLCRMSPHSSPCVMPTDLPQPRWTDLARKTHIYQCNPPRTRSTTWTRPDRQAQ